jgi:hypothetical protein
MRKATLMATTIALAAVIAHGETTRNYVQDGLLACWDGVENAGRHCHASSASIWKDVVGGREFALTGVTVGADRMVFAGTASSYGTLNAANTAATFEKAKNGTVEIVYASSTGTGNQVILQSTTTSGISLGINNATLLIVHSSKVTPKIAYSSGIATNSVALRYDNGSFSSALVNGSAATMDSSSTTYWGGADTATTTIGTRTSKASAHFAGSIYCIRVYGRQLTDAEIQANNTVDVSRFRQGSIPGEDDLVITTTPLEVEAPIPSYGEEGGLAAGATRVVSCLAVWTNGAENVAVTCNGWKLYDSAGNELSSGPETSFTYTHPTPAAFRRLEWQLSEKYKISATATTGGFASPAEQWVVLGETATVTATPDASHVFYKWTNDVPDTVAATSAEISFPVSSPMSLFATFGDLCQVDDISTLQSVINSHGRGDVILLSDGLHQPSYTIYLTNNVVLAGSDAEKCIIKPTGSRRVLYMSGAASCISNITITGGSISSGSGAGIYMANGIVTHCIVSNNQTTGSNTYGGGLLAGGGTVTHTVIAYNSAKYGGGGMIFGGYNTQLAANLLVNRCLVFGNSAGSYGGGGIYAYAVKNGGAGGKTWTMRNTTIARNKTTGSAVGGGIRFQTYVPIAAVENCIFQDNSESTERASDGYPDWQRENGTVANYQAVMRNCLFASGVTTLGSNPVSGDAAFKSLASHDYHLSATSDAIDKGLLYANITTDLDDYAVTDGKPDIGCYEFDLSREPFSCVLTYSASSIFEGATVSLAATPVNPPEGATLRYVWTLSDGGEHVVQATGVETSANLSSVGVYSVTLQVYDDGTDNLLLETVGETSLPIYVRELYATPADNVAAIMNGLVEGQILHLAAGTYPIASSASIDYGATVIGAGRDVTIFDLGQHDYSIKVNHIRASMTGVTVFGGKTKTHCLKVTGGTLTDARVTGCWIQNATANDTTSSHAPLWVSGGIADRIIIDHNTNTTSTARAPTWIYPNVSGVALNGGGTLRNSLVCHNYSDALSCDGTVMVGSHISGGGTVLNCTVADNVNAGNTSECVAILANNSSTIRNTIVARNSSPNWTDTTRPHASQNYPCVSSAPNWARRSDASGYSASYNCWGESAEVYGTPCADGTKISFLNPANGNWRTGVTSSCRDAGLNETWMANAIDLAGNPRIFHDIVDIGCYENQSMPHTILMLR